MSDDTPRTMEEADALLERLLDKWRGIEDEVSSGNLVTAGNYRQPSSIGWPAGKFEAMRDVVKDTRAYLARPAAAATPRTMETCDHDPDLWYLICGGCGKTWRFDLARPAATPDAVSLLREFMARPAGSLPTLTWLAKVEQLLDGAAAPSAPRSEGCPHPFSQIAFGVAPGYDHERGVPIGLQCARCDKVLAVVADDGVDFDPPLNALAAPSPESTTEAQG